MLRRPRAVLLDLDETLLDASGIREGLRRACEEIAAGLPGLDSGRLLQTSNEVWRDLWPQVEEACWLGRLDGLQVSRNAWRQTLATCGHRDESIVERALGCHQRHDRDTLHLFEDARDLLGWLAESAFLVGVVTNGPSDFQRGKLQTLGIDKAFDAVVISGEVGVAKPDPDVFRLAADQLSAAPEDVWHVGDSLVTDVAGAQAAGLLAVWLNRSGSQPPADGPSPDAEIASLNALPALLHAGADG